MLAADDAFRHITPPSLMPFFALFHAVSLRFSSSMPPAAFHADFCATLSPLFAL